MSDHTRSAPIALVVVTEDMRAQTEWWVHGTEWWVHGYVSDDAARAAVREWFLDWDGDAPTLGACTHEYGAFLDANGDIVDLAASGIDAEWNTRDYPVDGWIPVIRVALDEWPDDR